MFAKKKDTAAPVALAMESARAPVAAQAAAPAPRPKPASMIAQGVTIKGDVVGDGELHLDCAVLGDVRVGKLILGPNSRVEGSVTAQVIEIHGHVLGSVTAQAVRLYGTARIEGDITHEQLAMETGAEFQGRSLKFQRPAPVAAAPSHVPAMPQQTQAFATQS
ncbi:MAG: polymer-forming cytoskeletal protein [Alphaproteobacteria bacterium]|nr:polymer-forming cytoskeletal protein [Alphaproteobacteria bacterium]